MQIPKEPIGGKKKDILSQWEVVKPSTVRTKGATIWNSLWEAGQRSPRGNSAGSGETPRSVRRSQEALGMRKSRRGRGWRNCSKEGRVRLTIVFLLVLHFLFFLEVAWARWWLAHRPWLPSCLRCWPEWLFCQQILDVGFPFDSSRGRVNKPCLSQKPGCDPRVRRSLNGQKY